MLTCALSIYWDHPQFLAVLQEFREYTREEGVNQSCMFLKMLVLVGVEFVCILHMAR